MTIYLIQESAGISVPILCLHLLPPQMGLQHETRYFITSRRDSFVVGTSGSLVQTVLSYFVSLVSPQSLHLPAHPDATDVHWRIGLSGLTF